MSRGLLVAGLLLLSGCGALTGFSCLDDSQCRNGGRSGQCVTGYCAYPDATCGSGLRWSTAAADGFADRCVDATEDTSMTATEASTTNATEPMTEASSTTFEIPMPFCGDGVIDEGEECEPAMVVPDEHCNAECQISGRLIDELIWDGEGGNDAALALVLWGGDIAVAGHAEVEGQGYDVHVAVHAPDEAEPRWSHRYSGGALTHDYGRALAITDANRLIAVGYAVPEEGKMDEEQIWLAQFGVDGSVAWETEVGAPALVDQALALAIVDGTDFVVAGRAGLDSDLALQRYTVTKNMPSLVWEQLVPGFMLESDVAYALTVKNDNLLFAGGFLWQSATDRDRYLSNWLFDGTPSPIPCDVGEQSRPPDAVDEIRGLAVRPDGSIVAVGVAQTGETQDAWVGLYRSGTCELGWQSLEGSKEGNDAFVAVAVDEQGNVITAGWIYDTDDGNDTWLVAWTGDQELMELWTGEEKNGPGDGDDRINAIAIDGEDGSIVVAGQISQPNDTDVWVGRYTL